MAARLRAQLAALTADLSANKISLSSTQSTLSTTQSTVTITSTGLSDVSSNLYRVAQFDASRNATLSNVISLLSNKKIYEDKWTFPNPLGPYQVDAIPIQIKDKFQMPMFSLNQTTDVSGGASIAANGYQTTTLYDIPACPELLVLVPSKRTNPEYTRMFAKPTDDTCYAPGTTRLSLEDYVIVYGNEERIGTSTVLDASGKRLWERMNDFKTVCTASDASSIALRTTRYNLMKAHPDYSVVENNIRYPFKFWDVAQSNGDWVFDNLNQLTTDITSSGLPVPLQNDITGGKYFTQVSRSMWENYLDACGNSTLLNTTNENAQNGKLGLLVYFCGSGGSPFTTDSSYFAMLCASFGYVVVITNSNAIAATFTKLNSTKTLTALLSDSATAPTITSYNRAVSNSPYYLSSTGLYGSGRSDYAAGSTFFSGSYNIGNQFCYPKSPETTKLNERLLYQIKCVLSKLGIHNSINYSNMMVAGLSAGGGSITTVHRLISENTSANVGKALQFTLNDIAGNSTGTKPYICTARAILNWQSVMFDYTQCKNPEVNRRLLDMNNISICSIPELKIPMVTITGDTDYWHPNPFRNQWYNMKYQTMYQNTRKQLLKEPVSDNGVGTASKIGNILQQSMVIYKAASNHSINESPFDPTNTVDGLTTGTFMASIGKEMIKGWQVDQYTSFPGTESVYASGLKSELAYVQLEDLKVATAIQMIVHRFLGKEYPIPVSALNSLGMKFDIDPTSLEVTTENQYQRIGPVSEISYDASNNLTVSAPSMVLTNRTIDNNSVVSDGQSVALSVDASKNLVIDANSILFSSKPIFVDKFTMPEPIGPYEVESIPIVIQEKFGLPKFSCNKTGDDIKYTKTVIGNKGANVAIDFSNNKWTDYKFDTRVAPEMVVYVPSIRTKAQRVYSNIFREGVDGSGSTPTLGSYACALDDTLLCGVRTVQQTGSLSLDSAVTALKNSLRNPTTTASARKALYNTVINHADYKAITTNMKTPVKIWDHVPVTDASGYRNFQFDPLNQLTTDISNNGVAIPIQNTLQDGSKWTVQVTRSAWESTLDASGVPTQMLPVAQNINALPVSYDNTTPAVQSSSNKMGLWINFTGQTSNNPADNSNAYQIASLGYVAIWCHSNPILGGYHRYQGRNTVANVLANKNTDPSAVPYKTYDICGNAMTDSSGCFFDVSNAFYNSHFISPANMFSSPDGLDSSNNAITGFDCCRILGRYYPNSEPIAEMYERYMYEIKCVLNKLGIGQFINYNNVIYQGLSAGGSIISSLHNTIVESTDASGFITGVTGTNSGVSRFFQCNDATGAKVSKKPFLAIPKALFNYQMVIANAENVKDMIFDTNRAFYPNSRHTLSMTKLKVPMICFTGEYDISNRDNSSTTPIVDNKYNRAAQLLFQNTNRYIVDNGATREQNAQLAIGKSVAILRPNTGHNPPMNPYVEKNDGELSYDFTSGLGNYIKGWEVPLNVSLPNLSLYDRGIQSELSYVTQSDLKLGYAFYIMAHRFLGDDFPVPPHALETLGLKYQIAPLNINIPNDSEYLRVGPKSIVSYDASNNLEMTTPGLVIKSVTYKNGPNTYQTPNSQIDTINMTPVGQAKITVDASNNIVTNTTGLVLYDASGNARFKLIVDPVTYAVSAVPYNA